MERTTLVLFKPFNLGKWFVLGFCAFLAYLGEGGGGGANCGNPFPGGGGPGGSSVPSAQEVEHWIRANLGLIITIAVIVLVVGFLIGLVLTWLKCRGKFMFIDGIVRNRGAVVEPWKQFHTEGNSLFWFSFVFTLIATVIMLGVFAIGAVIAWPDIQARQFGGAAIAAIIVFAVLLLVFGLTFGIIATLLEDFVVPVMYLRRVRVMEAWSVFRHELAPGRGGKIVLYFLMKILLTFAVGIIAGIATLCTCCLPAIPYLGSVILLPLLVFMRCYSLCFVEQFGPDWMVFVPAHWPVQCPNCGGSLRGLGSRGTCPACGTPFVVSTEPPPSNPPPAPPTSPSGFNIQ